MFKKMIKERLHRCLIRVVIKVCFSIFDKLYKNALNRITAEAKMEYIME